MLLTKDFLKSQGAFTGRPIEKSIEWTNAEGETVKAVTYVRPVGYQTVVGDISNHGRDQLAVRIASHICDEFGEPILTYEDIVGTAEDGRGALDANLTIALVGAIAEVVSLGKSTNSALKTNSSANSSLPGSGAKRSPRRGKRSPTAK